MLVKVVIVCSERCCVFYGMCYLTSSCRYSMVFKRPWHLLHNLFCLCVLIPVIVHF